MLILLSARVLTLEEEMYKYLVEGNKKKKTLWKWTGIGDIGMNP